jgi:hypothetical protein
VVGGWLIARALCGRSFCAFGRSAESARSAKTQHYTTQPPTPNTPQPATNTPSKWDWATSSTTPNLSSSTTNSNPHQSDSSAWDQTH